MSAIVFDRETVDQLETIADCLRRLRGSMSTLILNTRPLIRIRQAGPCLR